MTLLYVVYLCLHLMLRVVLCVMLCVGVHAVSVAVTVVVVVVCVCGVVWHAEIFRVNVRNVPVCTGTGKFWQVELTIAGVQ